jgi:hypothetical protein
MQNGHASTGAPVQINPVHAAQLALMFLARADFKAGERDSYAVAEGLLNAIASGHAVVGAPSPKPANVEPPAPEVPLTQ